LETVVLLRLTRINSRPPSQPSQYDGRD